MMSDFQKKYWPSAPAYNGKRVMWLGDSITAGATYQEDVLVWTGMTQDAQYAVGGRVSADFDKDNAGTLLIAADFATTDVVHLLHGGNDFGVALGTIADAYVGSPATTFYNVIFQLYTRIRVLKPTVEIVASSMLNTSAALNGYGNSRAEYAQAIADVLALFSNTLAIDLLTDCLITPANAGTTTSDGVHPNALGGQMVARGIANAMNAA